MISKKTLNDLKSVVDAMKGFVPNGNDLASKDIVKSIIILEKKINYYLTNYDALNTLNSDDIDGAEK